MLRHTEAAADPRGPKKTGLAQAGRAMRIAARLVAAVPLGYAALAQLVALLGALLSALGMPRGDAVVLSGMLGFALYLVWLIWAFAARSLALVCGVALAGACGSAGLLWLLHRPGS